MDSAETIVQQPVSTLPDLVSNVPNSREGLAILEGTSTGAFRLNPEAASALEEQELSIRETPTTVQSEEDADRTRDGGESRGMLDGTGIVENIVDSSIIPAGRSLDTVAVQQNVETVAIEVDTPAPADTESKSNEPIVVVVSNMPQEEGHVGLLIKQAGGKSNDEGIAVEVVLNDAKPAISEVKLSPLGLGGGGLEVAVGASEIGIVGVSGNVAVNGSQQSGQTGNAGYGVDIEPTIVADANTIINSRAISLVDEQGVGGVGVEEKEIDVSAIPELEHKELSEVVISVGTTGDVAHTLEINSGAVLHLEVGTSIEEPQFANNLEGEIADTLAGNIVQFGNADASSGMETAEELVLPVAVSDRALDVADLSTADVSDLNTPELKSLEAVQTLDRDVDNSATVEDALYASDSFATNMMEGSTEATIKAAELDVVQPSKNMKAEGLLDTIITQPVLAGKEIDADHLLIPEDVKDASAVDREIVVELDSTINSEVGTRMEDLADLLVVPTAREMWNTPTAGDPLTSSEMDISAEQTSIFVQLDASSDVITSEILEAAVPSKDVEEVKPGKEGAITSGDESVAPLNDAEGAGPANGVTEATDEEPMVIVSAVNDSSDIAMPAILDTSAEEQPIQEDLGSISESTSVFTANKRKEGKFISEVDDTEEDLPFVGNADPIDAEDMSENLTATRTGAAEELLNSEQITVIGTAYVREEDVGMESAKNPEEQVISFQEMMTDVTKDAEVVWDDTVDNSVTNVVDETPVVEKEDNEMVNVPKAMEESGGDATNITEDGATFDDLMNQKEGMVAVEETIDTTTVSVTTQHGNGGAAAEDGDGHGVLIGVGSSVESRGLTITEIAYTTVIIEEFQAAQEPSSRGFAEPLVTPPEEEIVEAINDVRSAVDDLVEREELPHSTEGLVLEVTEDDAEGELNDLQTYVDGLAPSETNDKNQQALPKGLVLDVMEQPDTSPNTTVVVDVVTSAETGDKAEPLDLQDAHSLLPTATEMETETAVGVSVSPLVSTLVSGPEKQEPTDVGAAVALENAVQGDQDSIPAIAEAEKVLPIAEEDGSLASGASLLEEAPAGGNSLPAFESDPFSISMTSSDAGKLSSVDDSATGIVDEQVTGGESISNTVEVGVSDVLLASSANGLGLGLEAALDSSALMSESKSLVSAEAAGVSPVELEMDGQSNDLGIESALDVSESVLDGLPVGEALDRNEKKRGREEEGEVAEDKEKTIKTAKTSNGEVPALNDADELKIDVKIGEDGQVDKKRTRNDLETLAAESDISIQTKARKTGISDDDAGSLSRKADTEEDADDTEECVEMEDKETGQVKTVNGAGLDSTAPRYKKRKIALFLGYSGFGYQGMQKNPGAITIEGELEEALFRAGAIAESNYGQPQKLDWRRAARTDKGVSAVGQVVSGCFFIDPPGFIERVNSHLPKQIRVYGYKRATASFNSKKLCDRRKYEYVLPVYAFDPSVHLDRETAQALAAAEKLDSVNETETITTVTEISVPAGETEASMVIDSEMKECAVTAEEGAVHGGTDSVTGNPEFEKKEDNQNSGDTTIAITEDTIAVTETAQEKVAAGVSVETQEVRVATKEVTVLETVIDVSPEQKGVLDEKAGTAPVEVLVETKEVLTERKEVTGTVIDLSTEEKKEALDDKVKKSTFKFGDTEFNRLNRILGGFVGHHNFHNFTARTKATDPSANRYIISFEVEKTFTLDGIEFVRCSVVGQSFMLHQIRKMIGLAVAIMRGSAPESILATALRRDTKINVPMAPELGLFLEECYYSAYNKRFRATHEEMSLNSYAAEVDEFKKEFIYPHIVSTEARDSTFAMWLHSLNDRHYPDFAAAREAEKLAKSQ